MDPLPSSRGYRVCFSFSFCYFVFAKFRGGPNNIRINPVDIRPIFADIRGLCGSIHQSIMVDGDGVFCCLLNLSGLAIGDPQVLFNVFYFCVWID